VCKQRRKDACLHIPCIRKLSHANVSHKFLKGHSGVQVKNNKRLGIQFRYRNPWAQSPTPKIIIVIIEVESYYLLFCHLKNAVNKDSTHLTFLHSKIEN
jgi:hypothetical protein